MEEDKPVHGLQKNVTKAASIRAMCQSDGFKVLQAEIDKEKKRVSDKVMDVALSDPDVLKYRREAQVWIALERILKKVMLTGEFSARTLAQMDEFKTSSLQGEQVYGDKK